jgi:uncharacterized protein YjbJ (UPF0337 family)
MSSSCLSLLFWLEPTGVPDLAFRRVEAPPCVRTSRNLQPSHAIAQPRRRRWRATGGAEMDKDRIKGSAENLKGKGKEMAGQAMGDKKLETEGKADQVKGKAQNAVGSAKDAVRDTFEKK